MKEDKALAETYNKSFLLKLTVMATLSSFLTGYNIGVVNSSWNNVAETLSWESSVNTFSAICSGVFATGGTIGSVFSGKLANEYGRRKGMLINDMISIITCVLVNSI